MSGHSGDGGDCSSNGLVGWLGYSVLDIALGRRRAQRLSVSPSRQFIGALYGRYERTPAPSNGGS